MNKPTRSPCKNICKIDTKSGLCVGCKRTLVEIQSWTSYDDATIDRVMYECAGRSLVAFRDSSNLVAPIIATGKGDAGSTSFMFGAVVQKTAIRVQLNSQLDLVQALLSEILAMLKENNGPSDSYELKAFIIETQKTLTFIMSEVATLPEHFVSLIDKYYTLSEADLVSLAELVEQKRSAVSFEGWVTDFSLLGAKLNILRASCRKAEILAWFCVNESGLRSLVARWINRLSDCLWIYSKII